MADTKTIELTRTVGGHSLPAAGTWSVDQAHSTVEFVARHLMVTKVRGRSAKLRGGRPSHRGETGRDGTGWRYRSASDNPGADLFLPQHTLRIQQHVPNKPATLFLEPK